MDDMNGTNLITNTYAYGTFGTSPMALAFDSSARIFWTDFANSLVFRMDDITGKNLTYAGGQLFGPSGIALDSNGRIYIADEMNNRVVRMNDITGTGFTSYGSAGSSAGQFSLPQGIAVDSKGYVYVADYYNNRIVCFTFPQ
jgi:sugar lactone lactonase YvrE